MGTRGSKDHRSSGGGHPQFIPPDVSPSPQPYGQYAPQGNMQYLPGAPSSRPSSYDHRSPSPGPRPQQPTLPNRESDYPSGMRPGRNPEYVDPRQPGGFFIPGGAPAAPGMYAAPRQMIIPGGGPAAPGMYAAPHQMEPVRSERSMEHKAAMEQGYAPAATQQKEEEEVDPVLKELKCARPCL